jgi:stromal membrane-associated protein
LFTDEDHSKIENFIRTKYDSKRWTMEGPVPDPSTLSDEADDDEVEFSLMLIRMNLIAS